MDSEKKNCRYCGEELPANAGRCPFCGSILDVYVDSGNMNVKGWEDDGGSKRTENGGTSHDNAPVPGDAAQENTPAPQEQIQIPVQNDQDRFSYQRPSYETGQRSPYGMGQGDAGKGPLSNGMKVFLTVLFTIIPGLGQLAGIITAIVFMNTDDDPDRKSFGVALLVASLIMFVLACVGCFTAIVLYSAFQTALYR